MAGNVLSKSFAPHLQDLKLNSQRLPGNIDLFYLWVLFWIG
jgi:hypothetical protein